MGAEAEEARRGGHGSAPAMRVPARGVPCMHPSCQTQIPTVTIDSLQQGHNIDCSYITLPCGPLIEIK